MRSKSKIYTVKTRRGIVFHLEASNDHEARMRANSPQLGEHLAEMMRQAVAGVTSIEPLRGGPAQIKYPYFPGDFFE